MSKKETRDVLKRLKKLRKDGCDFRIVPTMARINMTKKKYVPRHSIYHITSGGHGSSWDPIAMLANWKQDKVWHLSQFSYDCLGISKKVWCRFVAAFHEAPGHKPKLRKSILKALGLKDIPFSKRQKKKRK